MRFTLKHAVLTAACMAAFPVHATNGYFLPGFGIRSQGMGGVGIAYGRDSLSTAANPANAVNIGMRGDMGFAVFNPERHAAVGADAGGDYFYGFHGNVESDAKYFIMPEMGFSMPLDDKLHVALAVVGNGGMNTTYPDNFFSFNDSVPPRDQKVGVDMMQVLVPITVAYKINEEHAIGASLVLAETRFRAYGLAAFPYFQTLAPVFKITSDPAHMTDNGFDYSYGAGIRLGWLGKFMDDRLNVGLTYASKAYMTKFDKYRGLFAEQGDFDIPENYGIGIAIKPVKNLVVAADVMRINYSNVASVGNPGMSSPVGPMGIPSVADTIKTGTTDKQLGMDNGMGFGWTDQTVYKLGVQYGVNNKLKLRAGYNYGKSPIPDNQVTFNLLAPATVERHYSLGFTYKANDNLEVSGTYMYAASNSQTACGQNILNCASFNMHQNMFGLTFGWVLDPGPVALEEYGESDWAGINFDGWYAGLGIGQSKYGDIDEASANTRTEGWKVYGGYQFNKYLGVEGGYANLNDMTARTGAVVTNVAADAWTLGAVVSYPVTGKLSVMGKLGAAYMLADVKVKNGTALTVRSGDDSYEPNYGVGISYALLDNLNLRVEWERFDRKEYDIDLVTAGMALEF
ncbi:outer membrane protein transport protein [Thiobacillus denitrificans]|uniref:outer membrane protein transport protein n=1 Tax=Thiobacillus denitrificans TaxID=36861 RepID=UPI0004777CF8|nr:outer membrane protein transport protein [Thiobacillus denitrificans]